MNVTVSLDALWNMIASLSPDNQRWLADKLYEHIEEEEAKEDLTPYTMEEINAWIDEAEADIAAGRGIPAEVADKEMEEFLATL